MTGIKPLVASLISVVTVALGIAANPVPKEPPVIPPIIVSHRGNLKYSGDINDFIHAIGYAESRNTLTRRNDFGMLGEYQFSPRTLHELGFSVTERQFLHSQSLQDSAMILNLLKNYRDLRDVINRYNGHHYHRIFITKSGLLAGAHLVGICGVKTYFNPRRYHCPVVDGNGVHVSVYIQKFANYQINFMMYRGRRL